MNVAGVDAHVRNSYVQISRPDGQVLKKGRCSNTLADLLAFLSGLDRQEPLRVCLESTTNSRAIARLWQQAGRQADLPVQVDVLNARKLRPIAESVCKNDQIDSDVLCQLGRSNFKLPACYMPDDEVFALREHLRARADLVVIRTMLKNRVHAVLHRRGILPPAAGIFTRSGQVWLSQLTLDAAGRQILDRYRAQIASIDTAIAESTRSLRELARHARWARPASLLQTMPGIGLITALTILAELGDLSRFASRAAVANYAGLVPILRESNGKRWLGPITHRGPHLLRQVLTEAAWAAIGRVPAYGALYHRIYDKKGSGKAIVAVARRMLEDGFTLLKKDQEFRFVAAGGSHSQDSRKAVESVAG